VLALLPLLWPRVIEARARQRHVQSIRPDRDHSAAPSLALARRHPHRPL